MFAKRLLRSSVKLASSSLHGRCVPKISGPQILMTRNFANQKKVSLHDIISKEIDLEKQQERPTDEDFEDVKKQVLKTFKLETEDGKALVTMTKTFKDEHVKVTFDVQDEEEMDEDINEEEESENPEDEEGGNEEDYEPKTGIAVQIELTKTNGDKIIVNALASNSLGIQNVRFLPNGIDLEDKSVYGGPSFETLDETVRIGFLDFLEERGLDNDLAYFVYSYSKTKEQEEYMRFLEKIADFTK